MHARMFDRILLTLLGVLLIVSPAPISANPRQLTFHSATVHCISWRFPDSCSPRNSRPFECHSSWLAHFDSDSMFRHHWDGKKDVRQGLLEPIQPDFGGRWPFSRIDCARRTRRCFNASRSRATRWSSVIGNRLRRILEDRPLPGDATQQGRQQVRHRVKQQLRKWLRISSQRWHLVPILCQAAWNNGQHNCCT